MSERLEDLLVAPALLASLLVQVDRHAALGSASSRLEVAKQRSLLLVAREEAAGELDLVEAETDVAAVARVHRDVVLGAAVLGHRQRDPLLGLGRQRAAPELGAHARVGTKRGRRAGQRADEVVELAAARQGALEDRRAARRGGQLVVNVESADLGHFFTFSYLLTKMLPTN